MFRHTISAVEGTGPGTIKAPTSVFGTDNELRSPLSCRLELVQRWRQTVVIKDILPMIQFVT